MGDSRAGGGAGDGDVGRNGEPLTLEQLIARQGSGPSGRRAARRTGDVPIPLLPGESLPAHRGPRPAVPPPAGPRRSDPAVPRPPAQDAAPSARPPSPSTPRPAPTGPEASAGGRGLPPVPSPPLRAAAAAPPAAGTPAPAPPRQAPGASGVRYSQPVPPLPGGGPRTPQRPGRPLPPIPGLDAPGRSGATAAPRPPRKETRAARRAARSPGRRRLLRLAQGVVALVVLVAAYYLGLYVYVDTSIERVEALAADGPEVIAPGLQEGAATYLVVGTGMPGAEGADGVAALLARVAPDEESAVLISLPPRALVDTPACPAADGELRDPVTEALADSLLEGGPACLVRSVQQLSGLRVDHYLGVDLARLPDMVDALDGIPVCLPAVTGAWAAAAEPLPAGASELDGDRAAGWMRPGDPAADMAGTAVAERAQVLLTATLRQAMSPGVLGNPVRLTSFLTSAADALTVDDGTNLGDLSSLAGALGDLSGDAVQRAALPVAQVGYVPAGTDESYVLLDRAAARALFESLLEDGRLPAEVVDGPADDAAAPPPAVPEPPAPAPAPVLVPPAEITLDVLNGTSTAGLAATVADALRGQGFVVGQVSNQRGGVEATVVRHGPGVLAQAQTVAAAVPGAVLEPSDAIGDTVQLVVGPNFGEVVAPVPPPAPAAETAAETAAPGPEPVTGTLAAEAAPASASTSCG
ncbi:LCP family protein [Trujillonella humicola]|uniref:LCP family protein n=1 Tax=Trujillonella humicola TaxID=3383699 RepID=UPI0039069A2F